MKMYWVKFEEDQYARENYETTNQQKNRVNIHIRDFN